MFDNDKTTFDLDVINGFLPEIGSSAGDHIFVPKTVSLYHYTDLGGLKGIIDKNDLWLTHSKYLNDDEEIVLGYRIAEKIITEKQKGTYEDDYKKYLTALAESLKLSVGLGVYVCCFCAEDNLLSQWRAYGANGSGVSISFDAHKFDYITGFDAVPLTVMRLWKVFYEIDQQKTILEQAINYPYMQFRFTMTPESCALYARDLIEFFIPTFKNSDFKDEKEYRLIFTPLRGYPVKPQFRVSHGMLIPYYSLREVGGISSPSLPITGVRVGPSANKALNAESAQMLLSNAGYTSIKVDQSNTPYRT